MATFTLPEQASIGTQQQVALGNSILLTEMEYPSFTCMAMAPDGQRVTVQVGWKRVGSQTQWYGRATYLNGLPCSVPLSSLLYGTGELYLGTFQQTLTTSATSLASVPSNANYAVLQTSVSAIYNVDGGAIGFPLGVGQTLEISNRPELLAAQLKATSATGTILVQFYLKY